jgi:hypothetical protein
MGVTTDPSVIDRIGQYQPTIVTFNKGGQGVFERSGYRPA